MTWQLPLNIEKCKCLHIGRRNPGISYNINSFDLENVTNQKDLEIIVDSELKIHLQTDAAVKKANRILGIISKTIHTKGEPTIALLYTSLVRPHLEYANVVWGPKYKLDKQKVERVQRRATKLIENIKNLSYQERLRYLDMPSLLHRRLRGDMIETYKIASQSRILFSSSPSFEDNVLACSYSNVYFVLTSDNSIIFFPTSA